MVTRRYVEAPNDQLSVEIDTCTTMVRDTHNNRDSMWGGGL